MQQNNSFRFLNQYFSKVYVLTLERATDRHEKITKNLSNLNFSFFYGADKQQFDVQNLINKNIYDKEKAIQLQRYHKPMTAGQIGCSWSHRLIYEDVIKNNYQRVLILEDDVVPNLENLYLFSNIVNELPQHWDLLYLDYNKNVHTNISTFFKQKTYQIQRLLGQLNWSEKTINNLYAKPYSQHLKKAGFHMYTSAYAITPKAAQTLIQLQTPIAHVADHLLAHAITNEYINGFISVSKLFEQESQGNTKLVNSYVD